MKKVLSVILAIACCFSLATTAFASDLDEVEPIASGTIAASDIGDEGVEIGSFVANEYDMYLELQNTPSSVLLKSGYDYEDVEEIKSTSVEEILYQRGQMTESELRNMGYSQETIELLKAYDGSPIEDNPQLYGTFADLNGDLKVINYGTSKMAVKFNWSWSNSPLLSGTAITDVVTCGFAGTNNNNLPCTMTFDKDNSKCRINYYQGDYGYFTYIGYKDKDISVKNAHQHVEVKFKMSEPFSNGKKIGWAQNGYMIIGIKEERTVNQLYSGTFAFGYGHTVVTISPSISVSVGSGFSGGVGLSFGTGTENMFYKTAVVNRYGKYDIFNGN